MFEQGLYRQCSNYLCGALGVEERGGYYDQSGALRDMVQNHTYNFFSPCYGQTSKLHKRRDSCRKD